MPTTIGYRWSKRPKRDYPARCDICGVPWRRSKMRKSMEGKLLCPDDFGPTVAELDQANAQAAQDRALYREEGYQDRAHGETDLSSWQPWEAIRPTSDGYSSNLVGHWELGLSAVTLEGGDVVALGDLSEASNSLVASSTPPALVEDFARGGQAIRWSGRGEGLQRETFDSSQPTTYMALFHVKRLASGTLFDDFATGHAVNLALNGQVSIEDGGSEVAAGSLKVVAGQYVSLTCVFNGSDSWVHLNDFLALGLALSSGDRDGFKIGGGSLAVSLRAAAVYDRVISHRESVTLHNGFRWRCGLPIIGAQWR